MRTGRKGEGGGMVFKGNNRRSGSEPEKTSGFQVPGWNPEIFPGSGLEPEIFPSWNPEPGNSEFRVPEISGLFPGFSALFSNPEKS